MRILFIGDIVGHSGRQLVYKHLAGLRESLQLDFVVANAENAAGGAGLTSVIAKELLEVGVDGITLGDHIWDQRGFAEEIGTLEKVCRPFNLPPQCPGRTHLILEKDGFRLGVLTLLGRTFMRMQGDCPFRTADVAFANTLKGKCDAVLTEIHTEATAEKVALGWYLDGRASIVVGTHTHIPTADANVLPRGTAYLTDAGMTGPYRSVLGREVEPVILRFLDGLPRRWPVAEGDMRLCGFLVDLDPTTGFAVKAEQFTWRPEES